MSFQLRMVPVADCPIQNADTKLIAVGEAQATL